MGSTWEGSFSNDVDLDKIFEEMGYGTDKLTLNDGPFFIDSTCNTSTIEDMQKDIEQLKQENKILAKYIYENIKQME